MGMLMGRMARSLEGRLLQAGSAPKGGPDTIWTLYLEREEHELAPLSTHDSRDEATQEAERLYGQPLAWAPLDAHIWTAILDMDSAYVVTDL